MVSKSEMKKRLKAREAAKKKAEKAAAAPAVVAKKKEVVDVSDLNPNQYFEMRSRQIKGMLDTKEEKVNPWVCSFFALFGGEGKGSMVLNLGLLRALVVVWEDCWVTVGLGFCAIESEKA